MIPFYLMMLDSEEDRNKFELLYNKYKKIMFYVANCILKNEHLAEDAVHQTFLKILNNFDKVGEISCHKTKSYVVIMVRNTAITLYNQRKRHVVIPLEEVDHFITDESAIESVIADKDLNYLTKAVFKLPVIYRDVLTLKYVHEFSNKEIAKLLDISETVVRKRLERAKLKLREILKEEYNNNVYDGLYGKHA